MGNIDTITYKVKDINRYKTQSVKKQIIVCPSQRKSNYHISRLIHKEFGKTKRWNTFTIARDGTIYQHYDTKYHSDFLGIKEVDKQSISIVLENMGCLFKTTSDVYINWLNEECEEKNVAVKQWFGFTYWENFTDKQIKSLIFLCDFLSEKHSIPKKIIDFGDYHKDSVKFKGLLFRSNFFENRSDRNPLLQKLL